MSLSPTEVEAILQSVLPRETQILDTPTDEDWSRLESRFGCRFADDFKAFISLMSKYQFPGDILNVSTGETNGNDTIEISYDGEMESGGWDPRMIPFYAIGNGDHFCLNKDECPNSRVFYYYAECAVFKPYISTFAEWMKQLPEFLGVDEPSKAQVPENPEFWFTPGGDGI